MNRRKLLGLIGLSPLAFLSSKMPSNENTFIVNLIKRLEASRTYTIAVFNTMPEKDLEYSPTEAQLSFAQHFLHVGFTNNVFIGILLDSKTYPDFNSVMKADFLIERPDTVNLFQPDTFKSKDAKANKKKVVDYLNATFDYVIAGIGKLDDNDLKRGADKVKPWYLEGHTHLDLILRAETHTAHHRAQAIGYLRMKGVQPPGYSKYNTL
ncbi:DinB family protein [Hyunsoonleella jejuensis]|nr:DinB family protein [Hyunsoonleella jejuensis]